MESQLNEIAINGVTYVPKGSEEKVSSLDGKEYCIVRTYSAGVFAGYYDRSIKGEEGTVYKARRIYYWDGAATLSQLSIDGTSKPSNCKFPEEVEEVDLKNIIEVLPCTKKAEESIKKVKIWKE